MDMELNVRDARSEDAAALIANNSAMAWETEGKTLDPHRIGPGVAKVLADESLGRYWVAESDGTVVGQIMVTYEWSDWRNGNLWWIQSVYVHPDWRRKGVFTALYRHVESRAAAEPEAIGLRLYVEENNTRAQQTYTALGMLKPGYVVMEALFGDAAAHEEK